VLLAATDTLSASEIEKAAVRVDVVEADVLEVAVFDGRLHVAVTTDVLSASEIERAAVRVDVLEADAFEVAVFDD
jgi:hypothetical protein